MGTLSHAPTGSAQPRWRLAAKHWLSVESMDLERMRGGSKALGALGEVASEDWADDWQRERC